MKFYALFLLLGFTGVAAQEDEFGSKDVGDVAIAKKKRSGSGFWNRLLRKNFSGSIGHASILGTKKTYRGYTHARARFNYSLFENTKIVAEGLFEHTKIEFLQVAKMEATRRRHGDEYLFKYSKSNFRPEEFYLSQDILDILTLSYGVQKIVWGQFEPYSPTNLVFPFNLSTTDVEFNKLKGTLPQEVGIITFYPTSNISLAFYAFPKLTYDKILQRRFDDPGVDQNGNKIPVNLPKGRDKMQKGARLMFYPSWGTFGLSYHKGFDTTNIGDFERISVIGGAVNKQESLGFFKREMFGFELAIPVGSFTYKLEMSSSRTLKSIDFHAGNVLTIEEREYLDAIMSDNNGLLTLPVKSDIIAAGITGNLSRWYLNLVLFYLGDRYDEKGERLLDLEEKASPSSDDGFDGPVYPGLVISRYLNDDKSSEVGLAAGIISNGHGGALFYKKTTDSLVYGAAIQSIEYFSDDSVTEGNIDDEYEKKHGSTVGLLLSATYKF